MSWAIILCRFRDVLQETQSTDFFRKYFTQAGAGTEGAFDYWNDVSSGRFPNNSEVFGWFEIPHDSTEIAGGLNRAVYQQWGFDAAQAHGVLLPNFPRRIFFFNANGDHGDCGNGTSVFSYAPGRSLEPTFMFHEMGHNLGLSHSFSDDPVPCCGGGTPGEYCDQWDIMSAMCVFQFAGSHGLSGPGMSAPYLDKLGWLDGARVFTAGGSGGEIDLVPLNRSALPGTLAARIDYVDVVSRQGCSYFVELRTQSGWDRGLPYPAVLIHRGQNGLSVLVRSGRPNRPNLDWKVGDRFDDSSNRIFVSIISIDSAAQRARIRVQLSPWDLEQINLSGLTAGPAAADDPFASVYNNQWHVTYRDAAGIVWDAWYNPARSNWNLQQINLSGLTAGPAAAGDPFASVYNNQWHVTYRDAARIIWDSWYNPAGGNWNLQQINGAGGLTAGPAAAGDPFAYVYNNQWHVTYRDAAGIVWDAWYNPARSNWNLQQINLSGLTAGPAAAGDPFASVYNNQWHVTYRDAARIIWDSWYNPAGGNWNLQQINGAGGLTAGPAAAGDPFASVYNGQWHVAYRDAAGIIWDSWYNPAGGNWNLQQINGAGGLTAGPAAAGDPFASVYNNQWHVTYRDAAGIVWDAWYNPARSNWNLQQINLSGLTAGPAAAGDPFAYGNNSQWHVTYRDAARIIWDASY